MKILTKERVHFASIICIGIALRAVVSLHPHSGEKTPPMYGDYEAQRHWQELTVNLPTSEWYINSTGNNLLYWGLDYPPLTAWHSWALGKVAHRINPEFVELHKSRGIETEDHKRFMRLTVLVSDILVYIPALVIAILAINALGGSSQWLMHLTVCLFYPGQILIDNGHFQYNNMSLGAALIAVSCILNDRFVLSAVFFSAALNYKQMELYHALPFFVYLLRWSLHDLSMKRLTKLALAVILTFAVLWLPWLHSVDSFLAVLGRIFPIGRGVFEDKVSNVWCVVNVLIKLKQIFTNEQMALVCLVTTICVMLPSLIHLFIRPTKLNFLYALFNSSLAFFLFSFQVHEKSILLASLPALLLFPFEPFMVLYFLQVSVFSMFPLLAKDRLVIAFIGLTALFQGLTEFLNIELNIIRLDLSFDRYKLIARFALLLNCVLAACHLYAPTPKSLPHIFPLAISAFSCAHFLLFLVYFNLRQFSDKSALNKTYKKRL